MMNTSCVEPKMLYARGMRGEMTRVNVVVQYACNPRDVPIECAEINVKNIYDTALDVLM